jgi:UDP-GlcNAc:undecaprenyl-phosphate GlcNAc-1-phosphate transferase
MDNQALFYFFTFLVSAGITIIFIIFAKKISNKYNLYDDPKKDSLKIHKTPVSFFGGGAILGNFLLCLGLLWIFKKSGNFDFDNLKIAAVFVCSIISWFYGFWDDTYWQDRRQITQVAKIFIQIPIVLTLALILYIAQVKYQFFGLPVLGIFVSAFCFLFIENAVNIQDGLDGLAPGIILISSFAFFVLFLFTGNFLGAVMAIIIVGAIVAFLTFNWHPASIFLGNNGSYFLGFLMAVFAIMASAPDRPFYSFGLLLLIGAPIFNVFYVFTRRIINGRSFFSADRSHFHDDLCKNVKSVPKAVLTIYGFHLIFVVLGLFLLL